MKYLGIDYGTKRIGVALSDDAGTIAFPKKIIPNNGSNIVVKEIHELCAKEKVDGIVIGDSRDYHGRPNEIMKEIEAFSVLIQEETRLPIHFQLEFMTSAQASRSSAGGRPDAKKRERHEPVPGLKGDPQLIDASAAAIILQAFLDKRKA